MASFFANCISNITAVASHFPGLVRQLSSNNLNTLSRTVIRTLASQATEVANKTNPTHNDQSHSQSEAKPSEWPEWKSDKKRTGLIGVKLGMMPMWMKNGTRVPVTLIRIQECNVIHNKTKSKDGYNAVQVGAVDRHKILRVRRAQLGHFARAGVNAKRKVWEFMVSDDALILRGTALHAMHFVPGQYVDVRAKTIGKGFQGVMKKHGMKGQPATHGVSLTHRKMGATGGGQEPGRIWPGKKMPGRMGNKYRTTKSLKVMRINTKYDILYVKGGVPGHKNQFIRITDAIFKQHQEPPPYPTYFRQQDKDLPEDLYAPDVHRHSDSTLEFTKSKK